MSPWVSIALLGLQVLGCSRPVPDAPPVASAPPAVVPAPPPPEEASGERPSFLVIDIDSLRADVLLAQRDGDDVAPALAGLAREGVRFDWAFATSGWTIPSLQSLLSGRYPVLVDDAERPGRVQAVNPADARSLPEILGYYGYRCRVAWGSSVPRGLPVYQRGFEPEAALESRLGDPPGEAVATWLEAGPPEPFFLLVHELDLHQPQGLLAAGEALPLDQQHQAWRASFGDDEARVRARGAYMDALAAYDQGVARVLAALDASGLGERTVVVVTSNHGEELGEAGVVGHIDGYRDSLVRVPLVLRVPGIDSGPAIVQPVTLMDVAPTLLELAGLPPDQGMDGRSLRPLLEDPRATLGTQPLLFTNMPGEGALREGMYTLVQRTRPSPGGASAACASRQLFDLAADPLATLDICRHQIEQAELMAPTLEAFLRARSQAATGLRAASVSDEARHAMQQRGYWQRREEGE